jgi:hypothetical protein
LSCKVAVVKLEVDYLKQLLVSCNVGGLNKFDQKIMKGETCRGKKRELSLPESQNEKW